MAYGAHGAADDVSKDSKGTRSIPGTPWELMTVE
jgi:hypothetical protein